MVDIANELLDLIKEIKDAEDAEADLWEEEEIESDEIEEIQFEEVDGEIQEGATVVRGGKKIVLNALDTKKLQIKNDLKKQGKLKAGMKISFKKGTSQYKITTQTSADKARFKKLAIAAHKGGANAKRLRSMKMTKHA